MKSYFDKLLACPKEHLEQMIERQKKELEVARKTLELMEQALKDKKLADIRENLSKKYHNAEMQSQDDD